MTIIRIKTAKRGIDNMYTMDEEGYVVGSGWSRDGSNNYVPGCGGYNSFLVLKTSEIGRKIWAQIQKTGLYGPDFVVAEAYSQCEYWSYVPKVGTFKGIPSGTYKIHNVSMNLVCEPVTVPKPPNIVPVATDLVDEIKTFFKSKEIYDDIGALHKRGYLLYGPPGTGKSTLIQQILSQVVPKDCLIMYCERLPSDAMKTILKDDPRLKIFIFEELTQISAVSTDGFLNFLDGSESMSNTLFLGTTNYPEKLPSNIVSRPGRFDVVRRIDKMPKHVYKSLVDMYCKDAWEILESKEYMTAAQLRELGLKCKLNNITPRESFNALKKMESEAKKEFNDKKTGSIGFTNDDEDD